MTIDLDETALRALEAKAAASGVTPERLAADLIRASLRVSADTAFQKALADSANENDELLRRLAQ
jgi:hypothetical protein